MPGTLKVTVLEGVELISPETTTGGVGALGKNRLRFVRVQLGDETRDTEHVFDPIKPTWNQTFSFPVQSLGDPLQASVYVVGVGLNKEDTVVGSVSISVPSIVEASGKDDIFTLKSPEGEVAGKLHLRAAFNLSEAEKKRIAELRKKGEEKAKTTAAAPSPTAKPAAATNGTKPATTAAPAAATTTAAKAAPAKPVVAKPAAPAAAAKPAAAAPAASAAAVSKPVVAAASATAGSVKSLIASADAAIKKAVAPEPAPLTGSEAANKTTPAVDVAPAMSTKTDDSSTPLPVPALARLKAPSAAKTTATQASLTILIRDVRTKVGVLTGNKLTVKVKLGNIDASSDPNSPRGMLVASKGTGYTTTFPISAADKEVTVAAWDSSRGAKGIFIGTAKISLVGLKEKPKQSGLFPVKDTRKRMTGEVNLSMTYSEEALPDGKPSAAAKAGSTATSSTAATDISSTSTSDATSQPPSGIPLPSSSPRSRDAGSASDEAPSRIPAPPSGVVDVPAALRLRPVRTHEAPASPPPPVTLAAKPAESSSNGEDEEEGRQTPRSPEIAAARMQQQRDINLAALSNKLAAGSPAKVTRSPLAKPAPIADVLVQEDVLIQPAVPAPVLAVREEDDTSPKATDSVATVQFKRSASGRMSPLGSPVRHHAFEEVLREQQREQRARHMQPDEGEVVVEEEDGSNRGHLVPTLITVALAALVSLVVPKKVSTLSLNRRRSSRPKPRYVDYVVKFDDVLSDLIPADEYDNPRSEFYRLNPSVSTHC
eukprot:jgi/Mesvir1/13410/Mv16494-RA.2